MPDDWRRHYLVPLSAGGCDRRMNTVTICRTCYAQIQEELRRGDARLQLVAHCFQQYRYGLLYTLYWLRHQCAQGGPLAETAVEMLNNLKALPSRRVADAQVRNMGATFYESFGTET
ncbi:MAG: hypothetical protein HZB53_18125 [Chloroflexi bacterium]|nr:hypothetical protein [Chloroflexota bacterium]